MEATTYASSLDEEYYDGEYEIRETGGSVLGTGTYSETATQNANYTDNIYGINTIKIITTNIYDADSVSLWTSCKDSVAQAIADAFLQYLADNS